MANEFPQYYKGDAIEKKFDSSAKPLLDILGAERDDFLENAYTAYGLGAALWDENLTPLSNAIDRDIFMQSFSAIFDAFVVAGSAESYLTVFRKIFGEDVEVTFTVPAPGKLTMDILAQGVELTNFVAREIANDNYVFANVITQDGLDNIVFQSIKGFTSQYELEQMLTEMVPAGIVPTITLELGV